MPTALNGQLVSSSCAAASSVLSAYPRGAYTSGLLLPSGCLAGWQQHSHRLALSLQVLADAGLLDGPEASQQQLAAALEAAGFMPAQACSRRASGTAQASRTGQNGLVLNVMAHAVHYDRSKVPASVEVCVVGPPRSLPAAKDSRWPADRAHLQARMPPGAAEGILSTADGRLLEGFITNLFIISGSDQGLRVEAAAEEEGVLGGIMRAQVLQACRRLAVPVKLSAPCSSSRLSWKGAFLSNSLRGIQQVHSICNNERTSPIRGNWRVDLQMDMVIMSLISQIKAEIAHALSDGSSEPAIGIC
ncbi:hypothetical protein WJX74_001372 [Apatococcus lobatus]|uniref:Uncharacterized protein n=1 Tax=Apatococcus lobatus TaxID=904363 RepID=A0AAW1S2U7_9CHLO